MQECEREHSDSSASPVRSAAWTLGGVRYKVTDWQEWSSESEEEEEATAIHHLDLNDRVARLEALLQGVCAALKIAVH